MVHASTSEKLQRPAMREADPCTFIIFGATGDLTRRKLLPALYELYGAGGMNRHCTIIGTGRTRLTNEQFRERVRDAFAEAKDAVDTNDAQWRGFEQQLSYIAGDPSDAGHYSRLATELEMRRTTGGSANCLFYIATPSSLARPIIEGLGASGLAKNDLGWTRIVIEKPFGHDLQSGQELNRAVNDVFAEDAIFRIDHYLGKETVQNILVFRFGNTMLEPVWNRNYIDYVEITAAESLGVGSRAAFYEETGALRDMVTNHLLQLLTLTAMEPPVALDAEALRDQKVQLLRAIRPMTVDEVKQRTVRGQYGAGAVDGQPVVAYRAEPGVQESSNTDTYAAIDFRIDNWRWEGVPFYVRTGKRLASRRTEVVVHFKRTPQALFARTPQQDIENNQIALRIQPDEGITIGFAAKRPGDELRAIAVEADFSYAESFEGKMPSAYATLLLDVMRGDPTRFTRRDEVDAEWRIITPIEEAWAAQAPPTFPNYSAGSDGPEEANALVERGGHAWGPIVSQPAAVSGVA
ncbi:MAG: glucose-6-phosphate dehydrogenase [Gemmatimonadota bacterium]|nr:glucose-6-phosphate dehydrogenase [Gemmatimonadota bacterium]